jgi:glutathione synthase/RimK-type ligase-like ATP-grasp enzyme
VAFVTYSGEPTLTADDRLAADALATSGVRAEPVCWDDSGVDWRTYGAIVVRSTWDYHHRAPEFRAWIDRLEAIGAPVWNPPSVLRWNMDKRYLADLADAPLGPPPTEIIAQGSTLTLSDFLDARGWTDAVMKPVISADAFSTERTSRDGAAGHQRQLDAMLARGDVIIQPFVRAIRQAGELSLMFFGGAFSHTVRKSPRDGEFRVQEWLGGTQAAVEASPALVAAAGSLLARVAAGCLYARVDVVETPTRPMLMELELIEPALFLEHHRPAAMAFATAIKRVASTPLPVA